MEARYVGSYSSSSGDGYRIPVAIGDCCQPQQAIIACPAQDCQRILLQSVLDKRQVLL